MRLFSLVLVFSALIVPSFAQAALTKGQLKAVLAEADAKGQPDDAEIKVNGAGVNGTVHVELGKFRKNPDGSDIVEVAPFCDITQ